MIASGQPSSALRTPAVLWSWTANDPDLPTVEHQRAWRWLGLHNINPALVIRAHVEVSDRAAVLVADVTVPLPDGSLATHRAHRDVHQPPPVPWTA